MIKCVILSTQRSGSTVLADYLSSGEDILIHSELFQVLNKQLDRSTNEPRHYAISYERFRKSTPLHQVAHRISRRRMIERYLRTTYQVRDNLAALGMKFMYGQAHRFPEVVDWLVDNKVKFIHLIRENSLDMIVSRELAAKRGTHSMLQDLPMVKVQLDPIKLREELESCAQEIDQYRELCAGLVSHEVSYEAFVTDMHNESQRILEFLQIPGGREFSSVLKKTNTNSKAETIENYAEIEQSLRGTRFESYLD